jgi:DNA-binding NarL/FixJ family response regulator
VLAIAATTVEKVRLMLVRIAVSDPLPVYQHGLIAMLGEAGFSPEAPDDLLAWAGQEQRQVVVMTLRSPEDWSLVAALRRRRMDLVIVAVLEETTVPSYVRALIAGATAVVRRDASPAMMRRIFEDAVNGMSLLPVDVVRVLASADEPSGTDEGGVALSHREVEWLRELASGATVAKLAEKAGYSERAMFRLLKNLYSQMGVQGRTQALMLAKERGWLG